MKLIHLLIITFLSFSWTYAAKKPNILFIAIDDLRPEIGPYEKNRAITPHLDAFAKSSSRFDRAYVTYPLCLPSRASMLTGKRIDYKGADKGKGFPGLIDQGQTWPKTFRQAGYWTATSGKIYHGSVPKVDLEAWDAPGKFWKNDFKDWSPELMTKVVAEGGDAEALASFKKKGKGSGALIWQAIDGDDDILTDGQTATEVIGYLKNRPKDKPFVICAGFARPHMPWLAPKKYFDLYENQSFDLAYMPNDADRKVLREDTGSGVSKKNAQWNEGVDDQQAKDLIKGYLASTSYADAQVGRILEALKQENLDKNTIIVIWGDHGYHLTDHGLWRKNTIYHISNRIPFMMKLPQQTQAQVISGLVESIDIYPTLLDLCQIEFSDSDLDGRSLSPLLKEPQSKWGYPAFISGGQSYGIVTKQYRFSWSKKDPIKLFDLEVDPHEWNNLANLPEYKNLVDKFTQKVKSKWKKD